MALHLSNPNLKLDRTPEVTTYEDVFFSNRSGSLELDNRDHADADSDFGGTDARKKLEKSLLRKLDLRMSILVIIYILNYVSVSITVKLFLFLSSLHRLIAIMHRECQSAICTLYLLFLIL